MYEYIGDQIEVWVKFGSKKMKVRPFWLDWNGRRYLIKQVTYIRKYPEGGIVWHVFSANDGSNFFELKYDSVAMKWILGRISDNETH